MKLNLDKTYYYGRRQYGPGDDVEVPDEIAPLIKKGMKGGKRQAAPEKSATKK